MADRVTGDVIFLDVAIQTSTRIGCCTFSIRARVLTDWYAIKVVIQKIAWVTFMTMRCVVFCKAFMANASVVNAIRVKTWTVTFRFDAGVFVWRVQYGRWITVTYFGGDALAPDATSSAYWWTQVFVYRVFPSVATNSLFHCFFVPLKRLLQWITWNYNKNTKYK